MNLPIFCHLLCKPCTDRLGPRRSPSQAAAGALEKKKLDKPTSIAYHIVNLFCLKGYAVMMSSPPAFMIPADAAKEIAQLPILYICAGIIIISRRRNRMSAPSAA
jgi:hypothetical protein